MAIQPITSHPRISGKSDGYMHQMPKVKSFDFYIKPFSEGFEFICHFESSVISDERSLCLLFWDIFRGANP